MGQAGGRDRACGGSGLRESPGLWRNGQGGALAGPEEPELAQVSRAGECDAKGWAGCDDEVYHRKDTLVLSNARAVALVPVDQLPRVPSATLRVVSVTASRGPQDPSASSVPLATGGSRRRAAGVSTGVWEGRVERQASLDAYSHICLTLFLQAASVPEATVTPTRAAAPVPQGSVGSAVTPAASSTRCLYRAGLGAMVYTVKVRLHSTILSLCPLFLLYLVFGVPRSDGLVSFPCIK